MTQELVLDCEDILNACAEYVKRRGWRVSKRKQWQNPNNTPLHEACKAKGDKWCCTLVFIVEPEQPDGTPYRGNQPDKPLDTKP